MCNTNNIIFRARKAVFLYGKAKFTDKRAYLFRYLKLDNLNNLHN